MTNAINLKTLSTVFGGLNNISSLMTYRDLSYIGAFPSNAFSLLTSDILSLYGDTDYLINLLQYNYIPEDTYSVYDKNYQWLYDSKSSGYWGDSDLDRQYLQTVNHGDYCHLHFNGDGKSKIFLLWFATQLTPQTYTDSLNNLKAKTSLNIVNFDSNELYLDAKDISGPDTIYIHVLNGEWDKGYTPKEIIENPTSTVNVFTESKYLTIRQFKSSWFVLTSGYFTDEGVYTANSLLKIVDEYGVGLERLRRIKSGSYFVHVGNESNFNLYGASLNSQIGADEFLGSKVSKIKLFGSLMFDEPFNLTLNVNFTLSLVNFKVNGNSITTVGATSSYGNINVLTFNVFGASTILNRKVDINSYGNITYNIQVSESTTEITADNVFVTLVPEVELLTNRPISQPTTFINVEWLAEIEIELLPNISLTIE